MWPTNFPLWLQERASDDVEIDSEASSLSDRLDEVQVNGPINEGFEVYVVCADVFLGCVPPYLQQRKVEFFLEQVLAELVSRGSLLEVNGYSAKRFTVNNDEAKLLWLLPEETSFFGSSSASASSSSPPLDVFSVEPDSAITASEPWRCVAGVSNQEYLRSCRLNMCSLIALHPGIRLQSLAR